MKLSKKDGIVEVLIVLVLAFCVEGCGVKGDPLPPEKPVELGRGRPNYRRATQGLKVNRGQKSTEPSAESLDQEDEESRDKEEL